MIMRWKKRTWYVPSTSELYLHYTVNLCTDGSFVCTCPIFKSRGGECKHIKKVKMSIAGEKQKNKLPGVET